MNHIKCFLFLASISFICACGSEEPVDPNQGGNTDSQIETKSLEFSVNLGGDVPFTWSASDKLKVGDPTTGANYGSATLIEGAGTASGVFKITKTLAAGTKLCLIYPADKTLGNNASLYTDQTQEGFGDQAIGRYLFAVSDAFASASTNTVTLNNPFSAVRVRLDAQSLMGYKLSSVTVRCAEAALSGSYTIEKQSLALKVADAKSSVTLKLVDKPAISNADQYVTLVVFPCDLSGKSPTLEISLETSDGFPSSKSYNVDLGRLEAGKTTEIKLSTLSSSEYVLTDVPYYWFRNGEYVNAPSRTVSGMNNLEKRSDFADRDQWGGAEGIRPTRITSANPEGFWRTGYYKDKKVFVDPDGNVAFLTGFNFVCPDANIDNSAAQVQNYYKAKFASLDEWASWCAPKIADMGYNFYSSSPRRINYYDNMPSPGISITNSAQQILRQGNGIRKVSQCENLFLLRSFYWDYRAISGKSFDPKIQTEFTLMFDSDYLAKIKEISQYGADLFKNDKEFIGYYFDNELPFLGTTPTYPVALTLKGFLDLTTDPSDANYFRCNDNARKWALDWMQATYGTQTYSSSMEKSFLAAVADYYFKTATEAIRAVDSNHLILGCRLHADPKETKEIMEACARYCDVVSFNFYSYWDISYFSKFQNYASWTGDKPVLVSEFYTKDSTLKSPDGTLYKNGEGAGWIVDSQKDRGIFYQNNIIHFIEDNQIAGWQWFKWTDDFDTASNGWVNKGVIIPDYSGTYENCMQMMKEVNINEYQLLKYYHK